VAAEFAERKINPKIEKELAGIKLAAPAHV
jgi:hypothetical protein